MRNFNERKILYITIFIMLIINVFVISLRIKDKSDVNVLKLKSETAISLMNCEGLLDESNMSFLKCLPECNEKAHFLDYSDKKWYLMFIANLNGCGSCVASFISLTSELSDSLKYPFVRTLGVFVNNDLLNIKRIVFEYSITFPVLFDSSNVLNKYALFNQERLYLPVFILCDSDLNVIDSFCFSQVFPDRLNLFYKKIKRRLININPM